MTARDPLEEFGWSESSEPESSEYVAPAVIEQLRSRGATRVLDLGCGVGTLCAQLSAAGFEVVGADADARGIKIARERHPGIRFFVTDVRDDPSGLRTAEGGFGAVVATEVIEHLYDPGALLRFAGGMLEPGGLLLVSTPYHGYLKNLALAVSGRMDRHHDVDRVGGHIKFWSRGTLTAAVEGAGYEVLSWRGLGRVPYLWKSMLLTARVR